MSAPLNKAVADAQPAAAPAQKALDGGCCGGPSATDAAACCALDESLKAAGQGGCGCADAASGAQDLRPAHRCGAGAA
ncbi:MAG: hypothetical protein ACKVQR_11145 [Aquabacterium sp.]